MIESTRERIIYSVYDDEIYTTHNIRMWENIKCVFMTRNSFRRNDREHNILELCDGLKIEIRPHIFGAHSVRRHRPRFRAYYAFIISSRIFAMLTRGMESQLMEG